MDFLYWMGKAVKGMFKRAPAAPGGLQVSEKMANAITAWLLAFYQKPAWLETGYRVTNTPISVTDYMSTLACNEIAINAGASDRGVWINGQMSRFLLPQLKNAVQLAGAGGRVVLKPYPSGGNIYTEVVPADRIYSTRINGAAVTEAGFFTDFSTLRGRKVVRVEAFDLQPDGLYLQNRAYWYSTGDTLGGELSLTEVPEWAGLEPDVIIRGVDRPLFGELRMPMANTVDETSRLPVSLYARAMDTMSELDRIYSEFLWEVHTGKRKRIVDRTAIKPDTNGCGVPFKDQTTDLYLAMDLTSDLGQGDPFRDYTPTLRVDEYQRAIDIQCRLLERQTGFSPGTFSFDIKTGRMTATQVVSDDKETYNTTKSIQEYGLRQGLLDLINAYDVYATLYGLAPAGIIEPSVSFGDAIFEDTGVEFARRKSLVDSGYLRPERLVGWYFGVSEKEAREKYIPEPPPMLRFQEE